MRVQLIGQHFKLGVILLFFAEKEFFCMFTDAFHHRIENIGSLFALIPCMDLNPLLTAAAGDTLHAPHKGVKGRDNPLYQTCHQAQHHKKADDNT